MKLLVSWLRELADVRLPVADLASLLSMRGFEVASIEPVDSGGDAVIDFEITANRPDCLSVAGLAREAATACRVPLRLPWDEAGRPVSTVRPPAAPTAEPARRRRPRGRHRGPRPLPAIRRRGGRGARRTVARLAGRAAHRRRRPPDQQRRGRHQLRPARDRAPDARVRPRAARRGASCARAARGPASGSARWTARTARSTPGMLVIADAAAPQAVAGVMGGAASEVWAGTRLIAFESAYFQPASVRRTSRRLGLKSEASSRFERGTDINAPVVALERACALLEQIGAGRRAGAVIDVYPAPRGPVEIPLRRARIARLLGTAVDDAEVARIFAGLGFDVADAAGRLARPRADDARGRHARGGPHRGSGAAPRLRSGAVARSRRCAPSRRGPIRASRARACCGTCSPAAGFSEAVTCSFIERVRCRAVRRSPASRAGRRWRTRCRRSSRCCGRRCCPAWSTSVAHNRRHDMRDVRLFEIGACVSPAGGERHRIAFALTGAGVPEHWAGGHRLGRLLRRQGRGRAHRRGAAAAADRSPRRRARSCSLAAPRRAPSAATSIGVVGQLLPAQAEARELAGGDEIYVAELDLDAIERLVPDRDAQFEAAAPLPVDRARHLDRRRRARARRARSRDHSRAAPATLVRGARVRPLQGHGHPGGPLQPVAAAHVPVAGPHARRDVDVQEAMERYHGGARPRAPGRPAIETR